MAHHNKTPESVLNAPKRIWAWAQDKDGNQIKFEGSNRRQRRASGQWGYRSQAQDDHRGFSRPRLSALPHAPHWLTEAIAQRQIDELEAFEVTDSN